MSTMTAEASVFGLPETPVWRELRYSREFARLLVDGVLTRPRADTQAPPAMLVPGFMAGDTSLAVMQTWLRSRGHRVQTSGMLANVGCAERIVGRLEPRLEKLVSESGAPAVLIGQSRGGVLARALAARRPELVAAVVMLGSPVCDGLAIAPPVRRTVRWMAALGDLGLPGMFSTSCRDGDCCEAFRADLEAPLADGIRVISVYSRSDAIVDWRACIDPHGEPVEVDSSHCGMSVHPDVYRVLEQALEGAAGTSWSG
jgi:triacylglycerol lipase